MVCRSSTQADGSLCERVLLQFFSSSQLMMALVENVMQTRIGCCDSVPAHHRLVRVTEPVSGWHTPASDERLDETWLFFPAAPKPGQSVCGADEDDVIPAGAGAACFVLAAA